MSTWKLGKSESSSLTSHFCLAREVRAGRTSRVLTGREMLGRSYSALSYLPRDEARDVMGRKRPKSRRDVISSAEIRPDVPSNTCRVALDGERPG